MAQQPKPKYNHIKGIKGSAVASNTGDEGDCTTELNSPPTTEDHKTKMESQSRSI